MMAYDPGPWLWMHLRSIVSNDMILYGPGLWLWVPLGGIVGMLVWAYWLRKRIKPWKLSLLAVFPLLWIFIALWGAYFFVYYEEDPPNPKWVYYPLSLSIFVYAGCAIGLVVYLREVRVFASLFALLNLYVMMLIFIIAYDAIIGG